MTNSLQLPAYHLLPWEVEWANTYATNSNEKFKNYKQRSERESDKKFQDAFVGAAGELAFMELLCPETKAMVKEWASGEDVMGSPYDVLFDNGSAGDVWVDIKTTGSHNPRVPTLDKCNFWFEKGWFEQKRKYKTQIADLFIQMFYDHKTETAFFVGAVSLSKLLELEKTEKVWNGGFIVKREDFDRTNNWLSFLDRDSNQV